MEPSTFYPLLVFSIVVSIGAVVLAYLWQTEKTAAENAEKAAEHFEKRGNIIIGELNDAERKLTEARIELLDSKATNKTLTETNEHMHEILSRAYVRNKYGIWQAYQDWAINGDKKPKPRKPSATSNLRPNG